MFPHLFHLSFLSLFPRNTLEYCCLALTARIGANVGAMWAVRRSGGSDFRVTFKSARSSASNLAQTTPYNVPPPQAAVAHATLGTPDEDLTQRAAATAPASRRRGRRNPHRGSLTGCARYTRHTDLPSDAPFVRGIRVHPRRGHMAVPDTVLVAFRAAWRSHHGRHTHPSAVLPPAAVARIWEHTMFSEAVFVLEDEYEVSDHWLLSTRSLWQVPVVRKLPPANPVPQDRTTPPPAYSSPTISLGSPVAGPSNTAPTAHSTFPVNDVVGPSNTTHTAPTTPVAGPSGNTTPFVDPSGTAHATPTSPTGRAVPREPPATSGSSHSADEDDVTDDGSDSSYVPTNGGSDYDTPQLPCIDLPHMQLLYSAHRPPICKHHCRLIHKVVAAEIFPDADMVYRKISDDLKERALWLLEAGYITGELPIKTGYARKKISANIFGNSCNEVYEFQAQARGKAVG
ncbi:hypothetical protein B0H17DRAFT_1180169 [Mycena rosella]|uniref:Uncharacterized protein n=1 Tax=Mycena rosella TaxID=1033263 RepID=A0AAD7DE78_MYCRO|nr:hypothetical protein B0H17DRAFT_1180169 [Mycena rosella]